MASDHLFWDERLDCWVCMDPKCLANAEKILRRTQTPPLPPIGANPLRDTQGQVEQRSTCAPSACRQTREVSN